jgi:hypothetical protein
VAAGAGPGPRGAISRHMAVIDALLVGLIPPFLDSENIAGVWGTVRVPMFSPALRSYDLPEIMMLAAATGCVVVSIAYVLGVV